MALARRSVRNENFSALPLKADVALNDAKVVFGPQPDSCSAAKRSLFNNLVGAGEQRGRDRKAKRLCGLEVDKKLKFRGLLNRKIRGVYTFEDLVDECACASVQGRYVRSIGCKHAGFPLLASKRNGRQSPFQSQVSEAF